MARNSLLIVAIVAVSLVNIAMGIFYVPDNEWDDYVKKFRKDYTNSPFSEAYAKYCFAYNKKMIVKHNALYERGLRTYKLAINQFSDMRFIHFNTMFPLAKSLGVFHDETPQPVTESSPTYDPIFNFGLKTTVEDQGTKCNSGWAYAVAKCIEITKSMQSKDNIFTSPVLSAQNLIDCAGRSRACKNQVPQAAFEYLAYYKTDLHLESNYKNDNKQSQPGMCTPRSHLEVQNVINYSKIPDGDDETLMKYVSAGFPVVVEYNPTSFEFMHYSEGIFQQPTIHKKGSHFMVVIGYGKETKKPNENMEYWLLQNSFGTTWGEGGYIKIYKSPNDKIAKNALFTTEIS